MKPSQSHFHDIRGLRYHVRTWGDPAAPRLFLLHGWMDVSASFQFLVDALRNDWYAIAPDWRGFGQSAWSADPYWFPDYYADLDRLLDLYSPGAPANLVSHSMGGNIATAYAGIRPSRVARLVSMEGFGSGRFPADKAPARFEKWLDELVGPTPAFRSYASFDEVAERILKNSPRLSRERADFLARHWARQAADGSVVLVSDPKHRLTYPVLSRIEEYIACWRRVTAPTFWIQAAESRERWWRTDTAEQYRERTGAFRDFREAVIEESGHMMHHEQPHRLAALIEPFLTAPLAVPEKRGASVLSENA